MATEIKRRSLKDRKTIGARRRKSVDLAAQELVRKGPLFDDGSFPLLLEPAMEGVDPCSWAETHRGEIEADLLRHGALLFRGFDLPTVEAFRAFVAAVSGEMLEYKERSSPRSEVGGNVYTSTDHPADQEIFFHNENSYQQAWPLKLFFYCDLPPGGGGETPIADCRKLYADIPDDLRRRFEERGVMYVRNFRQGVGLSWQEVFQSEDQAAVESYCEASGLEPEWLEDGGLRTRARRRAVVHHPRTEEALWFNHATFFHISTLPPEIRQPLLDQFGRDGLPNNTYYGDGSEIEPEVADRLRQAYRQASVAFPWQKGDVLLVDNMLAAHSRAPFTGERRILVAMAEPIHRDALEN